MLSHPNEIFILHQGYWSGWKNKNKQNCNVGKTWLFCCMSSQMIFSDSFDILHFWWSKLWKGHEWNLLGQKEQRKKYLQRYSLFIMIWFLIKEYISVKRSIYLHYMARNNRLKMSKHKGLTVIDKKNQFSKEQFI